MEHEEIFGPGRKHKDRRGLLGLGVHPGSGKDNRNPLLGTGTTPRNFAGADGVHRHRKGVKA